MSTNTACTSTTCCPVNAPTWPPSPQPPWARPVQSPLVDTLTAAGAVSVTTATTVLSAAAGQTLAISLGAGQYVGQEKDIQIDSTILTGVAPLGTATWTLTGLFVGFTSLKFDATGFNVTLKWDGTNWFFKSGNVGVVI